MQQKQTRSLITTLLALLLFCTGHIPASAEMHVHFIDVGQGDAILVQCDGESMLIDAGSREAGAIVNRYLKESANVTALNVVIATHSHDDHLQGMPEALKGLSAELIYSAVSIPQTYWFKEVLPGMQNKRMTVVAPREYEAFQLGDAEVRFVNTPTVSENENDHSLACRIQYENTSLLLTADIEGEAEISMVKAGINLEADILKVAHHGGNTSSCDMFLNAVKPKYAIISTGEGNPHGHPHQVVLDRLKNRNIQIFRTDWYGTIIAVSDGQDWTFKVMKAR